MARTKLLNSGKLAAGLRRVYVSWLEPTAARKEWVVEFFEKVDLATKQKEHLFAEGAAQTGDQDAGTIFTEWLDRKKTKNPITDVVAVLTTHYLRSNTGAASTGELARFMERVAAADPGNRVRIFLAPVDRPDWTYRVRDVPLDAPTLIRLRKDTRYTWPSEPNGAAKCADEIDEAVALIIDKPAP